MAYFDVLLDADPLRLVGVIGFLLYVINYGMLTLGFVDSRCLGYFAVNALAAIMVLMGLMVEFNLPSAMIQVFYLGISSIGILMRIGSRFKARQPPDAQFRSGRHWVDVCPETGSPDQASG